MYRKLPPDRTITRQQVISRIRSALSNDAAKAIDAAGGVEAIADTMMRLATETAMAVIYDRKAEATPDEVAAAIQKYETISEDARNLRREFEARERERAEEHHLAMESVAKQDPRFQQALIANDEIRQAAESGNQQEVRSLGVMWGAFFGLRQIGSRDGSASVSEPLERSAKKLMGGV